jgi:hypothetical protein
MIENYESPIKERVMKKSFRKALCVLAVLSFVALATCTDPFESSDEDQATVTINLKTGGEVGANGTDDEGAGDNGSASSAGRAANYPPDLPEKPNPGAPKLEELRFIVYFTRIEDGVLQSGASKTITAEKTGTFKGRIETGEYVATMDVFVIKNPGVLYARGVADSNPIKINGGYNEINIEAWSANNAAPPVITVKPVGGTYYLGDAAAPIKVGVDAAKDGGTLKYQWYVNETNSNTGGTPVGGNSPSYIPPTAAGSIVYYYCVVSNDGAASNKAPTSLPSNAVEVVVIDNNAQTPFIAPDGQPAAETAIAKGETAAFSVSASVTDGGTLSYQWYSNTENSNSGGAAISGATSAEYTTPVMNADGVFYYYCVVTNTNDEAEGATVVRIASSVAALTVGTLADAQTPVILSQPSSAALTPGSAATLSVSARVTDGGTLSYQWHGGVSGSNSIISGATQASYTTPVLETEGVYSYYCVITNTNDGAYGEKTATVTSSVAVVTVAETPPPPPPPPPLVDAKTPAISAQPSGASIGAGERATLSISASVSDGGTLSYQWYSNTQASNAGGASIGGAGASSYTTPVLNADGSYYYYCVVTNTNNAATGAKVATVGSNVATVTVTANQPPPPPPPPPANAQEPSISSSGQPAANTNVLAGGQATLKVSASVSDGGTLSYQWYSNTTASSTGGSAIASATAASYTTPALAIGTYHYYCVITNTNNSATVTKTSTATSDVATVTASATVDAQTPNITAQPAAASVLTDAPLTLSVTASVSDGGVLTYQWYSNGTAATTGGSSIAGASSASYSPPTSAVGTIYYYVIVTNTINDNGDGGDKTAAETSDAAAVTVADAVDAQIPNISGQPANASVAFGVSAALTVTATVTDGGTLSYQWYDGAGNAIGGALSATYNTPTNLAAGSTNTYYCIIKNTNNSATGATIVSATSNTATVTVAPKIDAQTPSIGTQPAGDTVSEGTAVTLTVAASVTDGGTLTYQWYSNGTNNSNTGGTTLGNTNGANTASYSAPTTAAGTTYYYVTITNTLANNGDGGIKTASVTSQAALVTVNAIVNAPAPVIGTQPAATTTVATNGTVTLTVAATGSGSLSYQWFNNGTTNGTTGGTSITGATNASYAPATAAAGTTYYYVIVTNTITDNGDGGSKTATAASTTALVTVNPPVNAQTPSIGTQPAALTTVNKDETANLTVAASVTDGGSLTYQWFSNTTASNTTGTSITGATNATYGAPTSAVGTIYYYVIVTNTLTNNGDGGMKTATATSSVAAVTVKGEIGVDWKAVTTSVLSNEVIYGITYGGPVGNEKFVAVGYGEVVYSADGLTWTKVGNSTFGSVQINSIAWGGPVGNKKFVAVAEQGKMAYSSDGINWTGISTGTGPGTSTFGSSPNRINSIAWGGPEGNEKFVAVGDNGKMAYSPDGVTWTAITAGTGAGTSTFGTGDILGIAWGGTTGNEKFVAVGCSVNLNDNGQIAYSSDGVTWTAVANSTFESNDVRNITWGGPAGNKKFVAVGYYGEMAYSADGISWTAIPAGTTTGTSSFDTTHIYAITWGSTAGNEKFVAVANQGKMAYSSDGINWTAIPAGTGAGTSNFGTSMFYGIAFGNGKFVAGGLSIIIVVSE